MATKKPFTLPKLMRSKSSRSAKGDWYVEFFYEYPDRPGESKSFKVRDGINYIDDPDEKEKEAQRLLKDITRDLENGTFNPFIDDPNTLKQYQEAKATIEIELAKAKGWTVSKAIEEYTVFIKEEGYTNSTLYSYTKYIAAFSKWAIEKNVNESPISEFTEMNVQKYLNDLFKANAWSTRTFNNYLKFMITFFQACERLERTKMEDRAVRYNFNPLGLKTKKTIAQKNKAYTPILANQIKNELLDPGYKNLKDYIYWIFFSLMRPDEIRHLKVSDIDETNRQIRIYGKTGDRLVPITNQLFNLIEERGVMSANPNSFVFGYMGNIVLRRMSVAYFLDQYAEIRDKLKLNSNYGPYSWKHTAVIKMIKAGFKDEQIMVLTGHKTIEAFRAYKRDLVIDNSHVMKGEAVDF